MDRGLLKQHLEQGLSLPEIGRLVGRDPSTVGYWVDKHGLTANGRAKYAPKGGISREVLEPMHAQGLTLAEIADRLDLSVSTICRWLRKYGLNEKLKRRRELARQALLSGESIIESECRHHGLTRFRVNPDGTVKCLRCRSAAVHRRRRKVKEILLAEAGGCCMICGYDRCAAALEFHHVDPAEKEFGLALRGLTRSISKMRAEAAKCVLLCATCHAEVEAGVADVPVK